MSFFYSTLIMSFYYLNDIQGFPPPIIRFLNPLNVASYWFIAVYLIMYLFLPFINPVLNNLSKNKYLLFIGICILLWSFMKQQYSPLVWFINVYAIGGYIKRFNPSLLSIKQCFIYIGISLMILSLWILYSLSITPAPITLLEMNNLFILIISISIFCIFKNLQIKTNEIINYIAVSVFPIYLIHDNFAVRDFLWHKFFPIKEYISSPFFIFYIVYITSLVFCFCLVLDKILSLLYEPVINLITKTIIIIIDRIKDHFDNI